MSMLNSLFGLEGRRALVTGSSRGIGRGIGLALAAVGARVVFNGSRPSEALDSAVSEAGGRALSVVADLGSAAGVEALLSRVESELGGVDILVLNASVEVREPWDETTHEALARQVSTNFEPNIRLISALAPAMGERGWGRVLSIGSVQEVKERPPMLIYGALKAAQLSIMRNLARELAPSGVTFNTLSPGIIVTDRNTGVLADGEFAAKMQARVPMNSFGQVEDCVGAALFLCSQAGRYVTGERLFVDGGMHL